MPSFNPRRIDVHHHVLSPRYIASREKYGVKTGPGFSEALSWTPESSLAQMDEAGISTTILSNPSNWTHFPLAVARDLARENNEFAAGLRDNHPDRFGVFAALPMPDIEASLREVEYAYESLGVDGVSTTTNYGDRWPGDPAFDALFLELNRRKAVVFVHPQAALRCSGLTPPVPDSTVEFMFDITRCIVSMLYRGALSRYGDIRFIFTHGGGGLAQLAERIDRNTRNQKAVADLLPEGGMYELQRLYFDLAATTSRPAIAALRAFVPATRLLFGSDFPFMPPMATARGLEQSGFTEGEITAINRGNAEALFPRLRGD